MSHFKPQDDSGVSVRRKERIDAMAGHMRLSNRHSTKRVEQLWKYRAKPKAKYVVVCDLEGKEIEFGTSDQPNGGSAMYSARLVSWAKNPRVKKIV